MPIDKGRWEAVVRHHRNVAAERAAKVTAERAKANVIKSGRVNTGAMADGYVVEQDAPGEYIVSNVVPYYPFQEKGRRGFSAKPGKVLRFKPKGSAVFVFAKHVGPVSAGNFLSDALKDLKARDFLP